MLHKHHLVPRHQGGSDTAHRILYEKYGRWQDRVAWQGLAGIIGHEEVVHEVCVNAMRGKKVSAKTLLKMKRPKSERHAITAGLAKRGFRHTIESRIKMGNTRRARRHLYKPKTEEHLRKLREQAGRPKSEETKLKMSIARAEYWKRKREEMFLRTKA